MRARICFAKFGRLRFLGHLDVMRYFQHAIARSGVPIAYSQGFHPHMILSFAQPLALSVTSDGEYFDCELTEDMAPEEIVARLQGAMCDGFFIRNATALPPQEPNTKKQTGMSQIAGAVYLCEEYAEHPMETEIRKLASEKSRLVVRPTKNGEKQVDVRAGIHAAGIVAEDGSIEYLCRDDAFELPDSVNEGFGLERSEHAAHEPGLRRYLFAVDAGSENNISVELISEALRPAAGLPETRLFKSHRMELYGRSGERMVSLRYMR